MTKTLREIQELLQEKLDGCDSCEIKNDELNISFKTKSGKEVCLLGLDDDGFCRVRASMAFPSTGWVEIGLVYHRMFECYSSVLKPLGVITTRNN